MGLALSNRIAISIKDRRSTRIEKSDLKEPVDFFRALMICIPVSLLLWGCLIWGAFKIF